ncbi:MAG: ATP-dependent Clp protease ATP-binding subunit [Clostridiales bacterium]|nr:ATP-dependent Clp protease ATP-binding subunit [Clostridiales bacterium]
MYKFTERAEKTIKLSEDIAKEFSHNYVGTEHLLVALVREGNNVASRVLEINGVKEELLLERIEDLIGMGIVGDIKMLGFTPRAKKVLEVAFNESRAAGQELIGTEHILTAILKETDSIAVRVLLDLDIDLQRVYNELAKKIADMNTKLTSENMRKRTKTTQTPTLNQFGRDLTELAIDGKIDPVIGREREIERVIQVLIRRTKNNPCLIGEPGVGKTAIAEGLAHKIVEGDVPEILREKRVVTLDLSSMVAGAKYRGEFEERIKKALEEVRKAGNVILFIDEMHTIVGAGAAEGAIDAANILKPLLARGEIQLIGATTIDEYKKHIEKDVALERRFQPIDVVEPTAEETIDILKGLRDKYEAHHNVKISDEAIISAVKLSTRYINDRFLPDKAIDIMDEAASKLRLKSFIEPKILKEAEEKIKKLDDEKNEVVKLQDFEKAAQIRDEVTVLRAELEKSKKEWQTKKQLSKIVVTEDDIAEIVAKWSGIPVTKLAKQETKKLQNLEKELHARVIGQDEAVTTISKAIRRSRVGIKDPNRPIGSFLFLGPTGVGKTELCKALAEVLFDNENAMIRIDMSEYMEKHTVSRLIGSPPGYVGYEEGGQLTDKIRRKPYSVILFDEIEKAHPDVFNILLQIMEDGRLTDSQGRTVNFKDCVIIMTSNVGARLISETKTLGFTPTDNKEQEHKDIKSRVMEEVKRTFRPEFLNRIDDIVVFHKLTEEDVKQIADIMINNLVMRVKANGIEIKVDSKAKELIAKKGFDSNYGARPLRRTIQTMIEDKLAEEILEGDFDKTKPIKISAKDEKIIVK